MNFTCAPAVSCVNVGTCCSCIYPIPVPACQGADCMVIVCCPGFIRDGESCHSVTVPLHARHCYLSARPARSSEEARLCVIAAACALLTAAHLPLAAAALTVIAHFLKEPVGSNVVALVQRLTPQILQALQRPGLLAAACAEEPDTALCIEAVAAILPWQQGADVLAVAVCTAPAALDFALRSCGGVRAAGLGDVFTAGTPLRHVYLADGILAGVLQRGAKELAPGAAAAPLQQQVAVLHAAVRLTAWLATLLLPDPPR